MKYISLDFFSLSVFRIHVKMSSFLHVEDIFLNYISSIDLLPSNVFCELICLFGLRNIE